MREILEQGNAMLEPYRVVRIGPFSALDLVGGYVLIFLIAPYLSKLFAYFGMKFTRLDWLFLTLPIALLAHLVTGFSTPFTEMFLSPDLLLPKLLILLMLILGLYRPLLSLRQR